MGLLKSYGGLRLLWSAAGWGELAGLHDLPWRPSRMRLGALPTLCCMRATSGACYSGWCEVNKASPMGRVSAPDNVIRRHVPLAFTALGAPLHNHQF